MFDVRKTIFVCETGDTAVLRCQFRGGAVCCAKARVTCEMFLSVAMATAEGASIPKVAEELGISDQTLRNWIKQKTTGTPLAPTNGKVDDESMKFLGLETENRRLKKEMLQLKKWQAYLTSGVLGKVVLSGADCRHWLSKQIRGTPMKAQHFARNIFAAAVLSA